MISATGIGSGLDIQGLVDSLVAAERAGSDLALNRQSVRLQSKFSALGALKSSLSTFQGSLAGITSLNDFAAKKASSSDSSALTVSAGSSAVESDYFVEVSQLAQSHSLASLAVADTDETAIGTGTITIRFGETDYDSGLDSYNGFVENTEISPVSVQIDSNNNTLQGIMSAINDADAGVSASIINDGSGYRLLLTSQETGLENSLQINVSDNDGNSTDLGGLSMFVFDSTATNLEQTIAAQDANLMINGLAVTSSSNSVSSALEGVSIDLKQVTTGPVKVSVDSDTESVKSSVNEFIDGYNQFIEGANVLSAYNADTQQGAPLVGDFTLRSIEGQVSSILRGAIPLQGESFSTLAEIGITTTAEGTLSLDDAKFSDALAEQPERVMQVFAAFGAPSDSSVSFLGSSKATQVGTYDVAVTSLATAGYYDSTSVLPDFGGGGTVVIDSDNDNLTLSIDGVSAPAITLSQGTYTSGDALALELQTRINSASTFSNAGVSVTVSYNTASNNMTITSDSEGSSSGVEITSIDTNTPATLGFLVGSGTAGADMTGTINGEVITGTGNILVAGNSTDAEGLRLQISGPTLGSRGNVAFTRGVASQLDRLMENLLDVEGALTDRIDTLQDRLEDVEERRAEMELRWESVRERYTSQFNALDSLLGQLQSTSVFLEQQLSSLIQPTSSINRDN